MENQEQNVETGTQPQPELNITDLQNLRSVVETAARRGAFQAQEMTAVGAVFDRLNNFLVAVTPKPAETQTQPEQAEAQAQ